LKTLRKKTGARKKKLDQPDEFLSITQRVLGYAKENPKQMYGGLAVVGVVVVLTILVSMLMKDRLVKAEVAEAAAMKYYDVSGPVPDGKSMTDEERYKKAKELFGDLSKGGPVALNAAYYKANADMELGDTDAAIAGYKEVLGKAGSDPVMKALANSRLASAYLAKGDRDMATAIYQGILKSPDDYMKDTAHYRLAKQYDEAGKKDEALKEYQAIEKDFPKSPYNGEAKQKVAEFTGKPLAQPMMPGAPGAPGQQMVVTPGGPPQTGGAAPSGQPVTMKVVPAAPVPQKK